ncbi:hypothetical protein J1614_009939 [Plenodomus biglobosus]|nr:hypothetical protein J1614_009939 [Plenodomus biglobosus]
MFVVDQQLKYQGEERTSTVLELWYADFRSSCNVLERSMSPAMEVEVVYLGTVRSNASEAAGSEQW